MKPLILILVFGIGTSTAAQIRTWNEFKSRFNKHYPTSAEESVREANFLVSLKWIRENSPDAANGLSFEINQFADLSEEEFRANYLTSSSAHIPKDAIHLEPEDDVSYEALPEHFDWRDHIRLNPVENQAQCGSCWAFATGVAVEAAHAIHRNRSVHLSKQEIIDCTVNSYDKEYDNYGCQSGLPVEALRYVVKHGLVEDVYYPYLGQTGTCQAARLEGKERFHISNYHQLPFNASDTDIMEAIRTYGPVIVSIYAADNTFRFLKSGIMPPVPDLPITAYQTTHTVVLVGWGRTAEEGVDYWILRNQWGDTWADGGYARLQRHHNVRGVNLFVQYPVL